jgi:NAD(P)-dependent dehydrogenase (short-subunit alcohol dehydrogenase family)
LPLDIINPKQLKADRREENSVNPSDNTVLITGGASGIGLALAKAFLHNNSRVIAVGRNPEKLARLAQTYPDVATQVCDISAPQAQADLAANMAINYPDLNIVINNAGVQYNYRSAEDFAAARQVETDPHPPLPAFHPHSAQAEGSCHRQCIIGAGLCSQKERTRLLRHQSGAAHLHQSPQVSVRKNDAQGF